MSEITAEQFAEWKVDPVTKEVFKQVKEAKDALIEKLAEGQTLAHNADVTHGLTSKIIGQIEGLNQLLNIEFVDATKSSDNKDQVSGY